jgi:hypothetical protein
MPLEERYDCNLMYSPLLSEYREMIGKLKYFSTTFWNLGKIRDTSDLFFNGYNQIYLEKWSTKIR